MSSWINNTQFVQDGEPVSAGVVGRPDRTLDANARYLKDRLDAASLGEAVVAFNVTLAPAVAVGQPVYWDTTNQRFEQAKAAVTTDPVTGALVTAPSADVIGVCRAKSNATLGDVTVGGRDKIDLTLAAGAGPAAGRYFLSAGTPGGLTLQSPSVSVPVCFLDDAGFVYVNPLTRNFLADHVHFKYRLVAAPAGTGVTPPSVGNRHTIPTPNPALQGWLPANHAVFGGHAPTGAAWGYNFSVEPALQRIWPPIPTEAAYIIFDKGDGTGGTFPPLGLSGLVSVDQYGIWWMSDCYGDVPWPTNYNSSSPPTPVPVNSSTPECPRLQEMQIFVAYAVSVFATNRSTVTSLRPAAGSPVLVTDLDGNAATTGDLKLGLDLGLTVASGDVAGAEVLKTLSNSGFQKGYVVEKLVAGTGITLSSTHNDGTNHQATVTVGVTPTPTDRELLSQVVKLSDAEPAFFQDTPYISLPSDRSSSVRLEYLVPPAGLPASPTLAVRALLLGPVTGTLPTLAVSYRKLPRPGTGASVPLPTSASEVNLTFASNVAVTANNYVEVTSNTFSVAAGDTVLVYVARNGPDGYSGDVGLLRCGAVLQGS